MAGDWVVPDEGKLKMDDEVFRLTTAREAFVLDQFQSNTTVGDASTGADFTIATYTGYAQIAIARGDWSAAVISGGVGLIQKTVNPVFTCSGGSAQTIYGLLLRGATSGIIYCGVNYTTPISMVAGATDTINPLAVRDKTLV